MEEKIAALKVECAGKLNIFIKKAKYSQKGKRGQKNHKTVLKSKTDLKY